MMSVGTVNATPNRPIMKTEPMSPKTVTPGLPQFARSEGAY
jgi:hypothetical protein